MAIKKIRLNHKTDAGYDQLYPMSDGSIITYNNTESGATAVNTQDAIDEAFENLEDLSTTVQNLTVSVNGMVIIANGVTVNTNAWSADDTYAEEGYPAKADITISGATADYVPDVYFNTADGISGKFSINSQSGTNKVRIWATEIPDGPIYIPTIKLTKDADGVSNRMLVLNGEGNYSYCYLSIGGTRRYTPGTYLVTSGTQISCHVYGSTSYPGTVTADGVRILRVTNRTIGTVNYTVQRDAYIKLEYTDSSTERHGVITIKSV